MDAMGAASKQETPFGARHVAVGAFFGDGAGLCRPGFEGKLHVDLAAHPEIFHKNIFVSEDTYTAAGLKAKTSGGRMPGSG